MIRVFMNIDSTGHFEFKAAEAKEVQEALEEFEDINSWLANDGWDNWMEIKTDYTNVDKASKFLAVINDAFTHNEQKGFHIKSRRTDNLNEFCSKYGDQFGYYFGPVFTPVGTHHKINVNGQIFHLTEKEFKDEWVID